MLVCHCNCKHISFIIILNNCHCHLYEHNSTYVTDVYQFLINVKLILYYRYNYGYLIIRLNDLNLIFMMKIFYSSN